MRTQFLPSAGKITPERIAFPSGYARIGGEKATEQKSVRMKYQEIRPGIANIRKTAALFPFARWVVAFLFVRAAACPCAIRKQIVSVGKLSEDFTPA
jgi:hypothetical protein